jgi:hypothetical protein
MMIRIRRNPIIIPTIRAMYLGGSWEEDAGDVEAAAEVEVEDVVEEVVEEEVVEMVVKAAAGIVVG